MNATNRFAAIAKHKPTCAQALAAACATAHQGWDEVYASCRTLAKFAGVEVISFLHGYYFAEVDVEDDSTLSAIRDEAHEFLDDLSDRAEQRRIRVRNSAIARG